MPRFNPHPGAICPRLLLCFGTPLFEVHGGAILKGVRAFLPFHSLQVFYYWVAPSRITPRLLHLEATFGLVGPLTLAPVHRPCFHLVNRLPCCLGVSNRLRTWSRRISRSLQRTTCPKKRIRRRFWWSRRSCLLASLDGPWPVLVAPSAVLWSCGAVELTFFQRSSLRSAIFSVFFIRTFS